MFKVIKIEKIRNFSLLWLDKSFLDVPECWDKRKILVKGELYDFFPQHNFKSVLIECEYSKAVSFLGEVLDFIK